MSAISGQVLTHRHIFGLKGDARNHLHYVDESILAYPCGHNTVLYNSETREQQLIHGMHQPPLVSEGITALGVTSNRRYLAVAERSERGIVNLYDAQVRSPLAARVARADTAARGPRLASQSRRSRAHRARRARRASCVVRRRSRRPARRPPRRHRGGACRPIQRAPLTRRRRDHRGAA